MTAGVVAEPTTSARPAKPSPDVATALTVYLVLLFAIPSDLRIPSLGGAGSLAALWALACLLWWCWSHLQRSSSRVEVGLHPVRLMLFLLLASVMASYVVAMNRPISALEVRQADIGLLRILSCAGLLLIAADGLPDWDRLRTFLRRFCYAGAALAGLGLAQFVTGRALVESISIPGMVATQSFSGVGDRGGFVRAAGTAMSPLEYGLALSTVFPLALTFALYGKPRRYFAHWYPAGIMAAALLVSGSRSSLLGLAAGVIVLFPFWSARIRSRVAVLGVFAVIGLAFLVPGMIGTLRYLFTQTSNDSSAQSRAGSYDLVEQFFARNPVLGRGYGTFLPEYRILDNQYLLLLMELGLVGLGIFLLLVVTAAVSAIRSRRSFTEPLDRQLGVALAAGLLAAATLTAFFDAFSFPMAVGCLFLSAGLCGAYWRVGRVRAIEAGPRPAGSAPTSQTQ